jgi:starvation-inducible DNA-binding protein
VARFTTYATELRKYIGRADELGDPVTVDLMTKVLGEVELSLWFLESHLQEPQSQAKGQ